MHKQIIIGHQPLNYAVFDDGRVYSITRKRFLDGNIDTKGYLTVHLSNHGLTKYYQVARLVAEAFIGKPEPGQQVIHLDNDKLNNHADNLKWVTSRKRIFKKTRQAKPTELIGHGQSLKFKSLAYAAEYLIKHDYSHASVKNTKRNLIQVLNGKWKQTYGFRVKYIKQVGR